MNKLKILLCWGIGIVLFCLFGGFVFIDYSPGFGGGGRGPSCTTERMVAYFVCMIFLISAYFRLFSSKYAYRFIGALAWLGAVLSMFSGAHSLLLHSCWRLNYLEPVSSSLRPTEYIWVGVGAYLLWRCWGWWSPSFDYEDEDDDEDMS